MYAELVNYYNVAGIIPTVSLGIYASGDQAGSGAFSPNVGAGGAIGGLIARPPNFGVSVMQITVVDLDAQNSPLDLVFFNSAPTVSSTNNNPFDVSDAEMASKFVGVVSVSGADYQSWTGSVGNQSVATITNVGLSFQCAPANTPNWQVAVVFRGTPTFTATDSFRVYVHFLVD